MKNLISIIVPVYNVEQYLNSCLESLIEQSYKNIEIILVNDGSTDNSKKICLEFMKKDQRVKLLNKKNGGLSDARNYGVEHSIGEYIVFVDSDDLISNNYIEKLVELIENHNSDLGIVDLCHFYDGSIPEYYISKKTKILNSERAICTMLYQKKFLVSACGKIFKREIISDIKFPENMLFEDVAVMYKIIDKCNDIAYNNSKLYGYRHRENSITTSNFSKRDLDIIIICNQMKDYFKYRNLKLKNAVECYSLNAYFRVYLNSYGNSNFIPENKEFELYIKSHLLKVFFNFNARLKLKLGILLFCFSKKIMLKVYSKIDRWK